MTSFGIRETLVTSDAGSPKHDSLLQTDQQMSFHSKLNAQFYSVHPSRYEKEGFFREQMTTGQREDLTFYSVHKSLCVLKHSDCKSGTQLKYSCYQTLLCSIFPELLTGISCLWSTFTYTVFLLLAFTFSSDLISAHDAFSVSLFKHSN